MAVSRPLVLALIGLVLSVATLFAVRGAGDTAADPGPDPLAPATSEPASPPNSATPSDDSAERRRGDNGGAPARKPRRSPTVAIPEGVPPAVARALRQRRVIVLFFRQGGADDDATADAVDGVRGLRGVSIFRDSIDRLARYRGLTTGLGVAQAPAVVIIGPDRKAQLIEGFVDAGTLEQLVLDAR